MLAQNIDKIDGWFLLNKPVGISSRFAGNILRKIINVKKFGHIGTLDPQASGLLPIIINSATRYAFGLEKCDKTYLAQIQLGAKSTTDDREGYITTLTRIPDTLFNLDKINFCLQQFLGEIEQTPPNFSAIRVDGKRLYKKFQQDQKNNPQNIDFEVLQAPSRKVKIYSIIIEEINCEKQKLTLKISCGSGTYIRAIARDLGYLLGSGGYLLSLDRICVDEFNINDSRVLDFDLICNKSPKTIKSPEEIIKNYLLPPDLLIKKYPAIEINLPDCQKLFFGQSVDLIKNNNFAPNTICRIYTKDNDTKTFIGAGEIKENKIIAYRLLPQADFKVVNKK